MTAVDTPDDPVPETAEAPPEVTEPAQILHITTPAEWDEAQRTGALRPPSLAAEGFVHCSTRDQLPSTLARHFAGAGDLLVLVLDRAALEGNLVWEESLPGHLYPHHYAPLPATAVIATEPAAG